MIICIVLYFIYVYKAPTLLSIILEANCEQESCLSYYFILQIPTVYNTVLGLQ